VTRQHGAAGQTVSSPSTAASPSNTGFFHHLALQHALEVDQSSTPRPLRWNRMEKHLRGIASVLGHMSEDQACARCRTSLNRQPRPSRRGSPKDRLIGPEKGFGQFDQKIGFCATIGASRSKERNSSYIWRKNHRRFLAAPNRRNTKSMANM
jgi:hypothetical protein